LEGEPLPNNHRTKGDKFEKGDRVGKIVDWANWGKVEERGRRNRRVEEAREGKIFTGSGR